MENDRWTTLFCTHLIPLADVDGNSVILLKSKGQKWHFMFLFPHPLWTLSFLSNLICIFSFLYAPSLSLGLSISLFLFFSFTITMKNKTQSLLQSLLTHWRSKKKTHLQCWSNTNWEKNGRIEVSTQRWQKQRGKRSTNGNGENGGGNRMAGEDWEENGKGVGEREMEMRMDKREKREKLNFSFLFGMTWQSQKNLL